MNGQQNVALVQQAYADYGRGDFDNLLARMAAQIDWEIPDVPGLSFTGKRQGCDQVREYFQLANEELGVRQFTPKEFIAQDNKVVVLGYGAWTAKHTGLDFESDWVHVFTIEDGRIAAFREFMDGHRAAEAFRCYSRANGAAPTVDRAIS
ncbi:MAG TPA: nuclear transport factor 2 family protein [Telluria sp.]|nr:nuclear transport factor 2 family protein [Telluria sp.]